MRFRSALWLAPWLFTFALLAGCNGQSEGQVCSTQNGNSDCADNLVCTELRGVNGDRCCPASVSQSTTAVCGVHQTGLDAATAAPPLEEAGDEVGPNATADSTVNDASDSGVSPDATVE